MVAALPEENTEWVPDSYGISIPEKYRVIPPEEIDLVLCPCSAFDDGGHRLGMGAGYYDRYLPQCVNAKKVLVAFDAQRLEEVFTEGFDIPMDAVITETRVYQYDR